MLNSTTTAQSTQSSANRHANISGWTDYGVPTAHHQPGQSVLRDLTLKHTPTMLKTEFGSLNKVSHNKARMAKYTYVIADSDAGYSHKTIDRAQANALIAMQTEYIRNKDELIELQGWLGVGPRAVPVQWLYTLEGANIAGMQQILAFPREEVESDLDTPFAPTFRVVYTKLSSACRRWPTHHCRPR